MQGEGKVGITRWLYMSFVQAPGIRFWKSSKETEVKEMAANEYAGTQTEKNLRAAFSGESEARNKYTFFS